MYFQVLKEMKTFRDIDLDIIMVHEKYEISTFQKWMILLLIFQIVIYCASQDHL